MAVSIRTGLSKAFFFLIWTGVIFSTSWLAFAYLLPEDLAGRGPIYTRLMVIAFFGRVFTFHMGVALAIATVAGLLARRKWMIGIAGMACLLSLGSTGYACRPRHPVAAGPTIRLMAINLFFQNPHPEKVVEQIHLADPDVVVMEEYSVNLDGPLQAALGQVYPYRCAKPRTDASGLAIYSKQPFVETPVPEMAGHRAQIRTVLKIGDRSVALYAVHPYAPLNRWAIVGNRLQVLDYLEQLRSESLPAMLAGDWNFTPETANAGALKHFGLTSAFDQAGSGRGSTWPVSPSWMSYLPGVRIDHVYQTSGVTCTRYQTGGFTGSDHLPIITDIGFAR